MTRPRLPAILLVIALVVSLCGTAVADGGSSRQRRDEVRRRKASAASQLDALKASDDQLERAVATLDANVAAQSAKVDAARQAAAVAETRLKQAKAKVVEVHARIDALNQRVRDQAIRAYMSPGADVLEELVNSEDVNVASRKQALLDNVNASQVDTLDDLRAAREDLEAAEAAAESAATAAESARKSAESRLGELQQARAQQVRARQALRSRIAEFTGEVDAMNRQEASLTALINREQAASSVGFSPRPASASGLIWPVNGPVTSGFGSRWGRMHKGIDIGAPTGTPIHAAKSGSIIFCGQQSGYGNVAIVDHGGGFSTLYAHQSRLACGGGSVSQGQVIGYVGSTGHSTGPHLHFETRVNGVAQNPMNYLR
jgi:murein DD-endopeptidase MepM/ murein hydrolase activator NlpD